MDEKRNQQVSRILKIIDLLIDCPQAMSINDIHEALDQKYGIKINRKTVSRDLEAIVTTNLRLVTSNSRSNEKYYKLSNELRSTRPVTFDGVEIEALHMAKLMLGCFKNTVFYGRLETGLKKIEHKIGTDKQKYLIALSRVMKIKHATSFSGSLDRGMIEKIGSACLERRMISFAYDSAEQIVARKIKTVSPHYLCIHDAAFYLIATEQGDSKKKCFSLARLSQLNSLDIEAQTDPAGPEEDFGHYLGLQRTGMLFDVEVLVRPPIAKYVSEREWIPGQRVEHLEDGSIKVSFRSGLSPELVQWVLRFGRNMTVLKPGELIEKVMKEVEAVWSEYKGDSVGVA